MEKRRQKEYSANKERERIGGAMDGRRAAREALTSAKAYEGVLRRSAKHRVAKRMRTSSPGGEFLDEEQRRRRRSRHALSFYAAATTCPPRRNGVAR